MNEEGPQTLIDAVKHFADLQVCHAYMVNLKWPDGEITCPKCGRDKIGIIATRCLLRCNTKGCRKQFSAKVGTIFEDSPLGLDKWFVAVWCIGNAKNGISSCELARALGVTQKTAWFMLHRVRLAMKTPTFRKLHDVVESDETFVGGRAENMHYKKRIKKITGRGGIGKTIVHGLLERGGEVRAAVIPNTEEATILNRILPNVDRTAIVCTDSSTSYANLAQRFISMAVDHSVRYAIGKIHVNGLENFWSLLKRMLRGTYVSVAPFHLDRYIDEESWRFNERGLNDGGRFNTVMKGVVGKRITFRVLCAIDDAGFMGIK
jgi:transposase-like protein